MNKNDKTNKQNPKWTVNKVFITLYLSGIRLVIKNSASKKETIHTIQINVKQCCSGIAIPVAFNTKTRNTPMAIPKPIAINTALIAYKTNRFPSSFIISLHHFPHIII